MGDDSRRQMGRTTAVDQVEQLVEIDRLLRCKLGRRLVVESGLPKPVFAPTDEVRRSSGSGDLLNGMIAHIL